MKIDLVLTRVASSQFLRFAVVGACGFMVDTFVLFVMHQIAGLDPYTARAISIFVAMNVTWTGNRLLTFRAHAAKRGRDMVVEWARFLVTNALGALLNYAVYAAMVRFAPAPANSPYIALVAGVAIGLVFNFTLSKRLVFRAPPLA